MLSKAACSIIPLCIDESEYVGAPWLMYFIGVSQSKTCVHAQLPQEVQVRNAWKPWPSHLENCPSDQLRCPHGQLQIKKVLQHNVHILTIAQLLTWAGTVWLSRNLLTDFLKVGKPAALWSNSFELLETFSQWISTKSKEYRWRSLAKVTTILFEIPKSLHIRHLLYIYINLKNDRNNVSVLLWIHSPLISTEVISTWAARLIFLAYACWSEDIVTPQSIHHPQGPIGMFPWWHMFQPIHSHPTALPVTFAPLLAR